MSTIFSFGEKIPEYDMKVLNEREVRASAGILFLFAMIAFLNSWLVGDFTFTKIFVVVFLIEFTVRVLINPKYAPVLVISRFFVRNQEVEYVGAPQKRFAWLIGLVLAVVMFYLIVLNNIIGPFNLLVCIICLTLLFFEAAFGICLGCKIYNIFHKQNAQLCPGNACAVKDRVAIQDINPIQWALVPMFLGVIFLIANSSLIHATTQNLNVDAKTSEECEIPGWVKKIGHEEKWKLHNGCANTVKKASVPKVVKAVEKVPSPEIKPAPKVVVTNANANDKKGCQAPEWAIKMGHEEKWKLHNGCGGTESKKTEQKMPVQTDVKNEPSQELMNNCVAPDWAIKMGHEEMWKQHNCK